jgi:16S rRNA G966 N2-methylase RsmD
MIERLKEIRRKLKHKFKGYPIYKVTDWLVEKKYIQNKTVLEAFANTGEHQAPAYYKYASYFEAWEIDEKFKSSLTKNLPNATVKITNSMQEILVTDKKFDVIVLDAHMGMFGNGYCEHFNILPNVFRGANDDVVVILNVMPYAEEKWRKKYETVFSKEHLKMRKEFYGDAFDVNHCSYDEMISFYKEYFLSKNYQVTDYFFHQRHLLHYLAIKAHKI